LPDAERGKWVRSDRLLKNTAVSSEKQVGSLLDSAIVGKAAESDGVTDRKFDAAWT
jgi:hypothetical protein